MKILVTGSYGFLGYNVTKKLIALGHSVVGLDRVHGAISEKTSRIKNLDKLSDKFEHLECDISDYDQVSPVFKKHRFDVVLHFAAQYAIAPLTAERLQNYIKSNCQGFSNILQCAKENKIKRFVYASSTFVQDNQISTHTYGATKVFNEHMASVFSHSFGIETIGLRYGSTFGEYCRKDVGAYKVTKRMFDRQPHPIIGGYTYQTAFLWAEDAVDMTIDFCNLENETSNKHNVFTLVMDDNAISLSDMAKIIHQYHDVPFHKDQEEFPSFDLGHFPSKELDELQRFLQYRPGTKFRDAAKKFSDWYKEEIHE
jgi:UDP-glucuronate 4-epimerase